MIPDPESAYQTPVELENILSGASLLPALPDDLSRLFSALDAPEPSASLVVSLVSQDPSLTAVLLNRARLLPGCASSQALSLEQAIECLGFRQVKTLALRSAMSVWLSLPLNGYHFHEGDLWRHSLATARIARWLASQLAYPDTADAYEAGLLHDVGKTLLDQPVQLYSHRILEAMWKHKRYLWQVEEQLFGINHAGVSAMILAGWQMPVAQIEAIRSHHALFPASPHATLAAILHVANAFSPQDTLGISSLVGRGIHPAALRILGLSLPALERLRAAMLKEWASHRHRK